MNNILVQGSLTTDEKQLLDKLFKYTLIHCEGMQSFRANVMPVINGLIPQGFAAELQSLMVRNDNSAPRLYEWARVIKQGEWIPSNSEFAEAIKLAKEVGMTSTRVYKLYTQNWDTIHKAKFNLPEQTHKLIEAEQSMIVFRNYIEHFGPYERSMGE